MTATPFSLGQVRALDAPGVRAVLLGDGDDVRALPEGWPATTLEILDEWDTWAPRLRALDPGDLTRIEGAELVAPLTYPRKLLCAGANFYDHAEEMGTARPDPDEPPFFFLKPPTTTVVGPGAHVVVPGLAEAGLDWEIELAAVIGRRARDVSEADALGIVAGYTVANDLSARRRFPRPHAVLAPFAWDWLAHKAFDGSCPLGPGIVPAWHVPDPQALALRLTVDGVVKQDSSTADMVAGVARLVAAASRDVTLEPGDVVLTGTPAGVGMPREDFLGDGAVIVAEIDGVGRLETTIGRTS